MTVAEKVHRVTGSHGQTVAKIRPRGDKWICDAGGHHVTTHETKADAIRFAKWLYTKGGDDA